MSVEEKEVRAALRPLGRTVNGVRKKLRTLGITGVPEEPSFCVVAEYLQQRFPEEEVLVMGSSVTVNGASVIPSSGVQDFIGDFDETTFPELIRHRDTCRGVQLEQEVDEDTDEGYDFEVACTCRRVVRYFGAAEKAEAKRFFKLAQQGTFPAAPPAGAV